MNEMKYLLIASGLFTLVSPLAADHLGLAPDALRLVEVRGNNWAIVDGVGPALAIGAPVAPENIE